MSLLAMNGDINCVEWYPTMCLLMKGSEGYLIKLWDPALGLGLRHSMRFLLVISTGDTH